MTKFRLVDINSKLTSLLISILFIVFLSSCEQGCVEPQQFDSDGVYVDSNPSGVQGGYNGGQLSPWRDTNLLSNGEGIVAVIDGDWTAWDKDTNTSGYCNICIKKEGVAGCNAAGVNDPGAYLITLDYQNEDGTIKNPDEQNSCKFRGGAGLYIGLFGKSGNVQPLRVYQMFSTTETCDIVHNSESGCVSSDGNYQGKYIYASPNNTIFIKDDKNGNKNDGSDINLGNDDYHVAGEHIKLIINDRYYSDNSGGYNIKFLSGVMKPQGRDGGLLEYIVGSVEDAVLGKISVDGKSRNGGALEFLYNSIVKDSAFILIVRMCLVMYVVLFGIWVLSGKLKISQKEILQRIFKLALIIFFTTPTSWYWYNQIVVGFFKGGMDYIVTMIMDISDRNVSPTSLIIAAQMDRAQSLSNATRFAYVDLVIAKLFSAAVSKKIWGLVLGGGLFGIIYVAITYLLIFAFVYIMLSAALVYISALMRLIFVLCLGPIFMITLLFGKTDDIYKRWLSFMGSQAVQIIALFLVVYLFLTMIDVQFNELFLFRACTITFPFPLVNFNVAISEPNRDIIGWLVIFSKIGILLFLLKMVMEKIPGFAGQLVVIGGKAADNSLTFVDNTNNSAFGLAKGIMGKAMSGIRDYAIPMGAPAINAAGKVVSGLSDQIGLSGAINLVREAIPFRAPTTMYRDYCIGNVIDAKMALGQQERHAGKALDAFVRSETLKELGKQDPKNMFGLSNSFGGIGSSMLGTNDQKAILDRLDKKLVQEPLAKAISESIKEVKDKAKANDIPLDKKAMREAISDKVQEKMKTQGVVASEARIKEMLEKKGEFRSQIKKEGALTSSEAAQKFANDKKAKTRYLQHLEKEQYAKENYKSNKSWYQKPGEFFNNVGKSLSRETAYNPEIARSNFLHKVANEEWYQKNKGDIYLSDVRQTFNDFFWRAKSEQQTTDAKRKEVLMDYFKQDKASRNKEDEKNMRDVAFKLMDEENKKAKENLLKQNKLNKGLIEVLTSDRDSKYTEVAPDPSIANATLAELKMTDALENTTQSNINLLKKELELLKGGVEPLPDPTDEKGKKDLEKDLEKDLMNLLQGVTPETPEADLSGINDKLKTFYKGEQCAIKSKIIDLKTQQLGKENEKKLLDPIKDKSAIQKLESELAAVMNDISKEESDSKRIDDQLNDIK